MKRHLLMTVAVLALAPTLALAEAPVVAAPGTSGQMAPAATAGNTTAKGAASDSTAVQLATPAYVEKAAAGDMFEIESSKLALQKSKNADVKAFAKMMVSAHTKTTRELTAAVKAEKIDVAIPAKLDDEHEAKLAKLKDLSGAEFDKAYLDAQVEGHQAALEVQQGYAASGDNAKLKLWAGKTAKAVQMHLTKAESLDKTLGKS
jgi:putative membrane protein